MSTIYLNWIVNLMIFKHDFDHELSHYSFDILKCKYSMQIIFKVVRPKIYIC